MVCRCYVFVCDDASKSTIQMVYRRLTVQWSYAIFNKKGNSRKFQAQICIIEQIVSGPEYHIRESV